MAAEVKDKAFTPNDIEHAAAKLKGSGLQTLYFLKGPRATSSEDAEAIGKVLAAVNYGVEVFYLDLRTWANAVVAMAPEDITLDVVAEKILDFADEAKVLPATRKYLHVLIESFAENG